jgi:hypothetical protein
MTTFLLHSLTRQFGYPLGLGLFDLLAPFADLLPLSIITQTTPSFAGYDP